MKLAAIILLGVSGLATQAFADPKGLEEAVSIKFNKEIGFGINKEQHTNATKLHDFKLNQNARCTLAVSVPPLSIAFLSAGRSLDIKIYREDSGELTKISLVDEHGAEKARMRCWGDGRGKLLSADAIDPKEVEEALDASITKTEYKRHNIRYEGIDSDANSSLEFEI